MRANLCSRCRSVNIGPSCHSKQVKVVYDPQKVSSDSYFLLRTPDHKGEPGNPSAPTGFNGKSATNFRS